jgi:hypothetical protein
VSNAVLAKPAARGERRMIVSAGGPSRVVQFWDTSMVNRGDDPATIFTSPDVTRIAIGPRALHHTTIVISNVGRDKSFADDLN